MALRTSEEKSALLGREDQGRSAEKTMTFAYSGDPDDAFAFHGLESGAIGLPEGFKGRFISSTVQKLNERAIEGDYEVSAMSSAAYPFMHEKYFISSAGASVGRNYGPMLASKRYSTLEELQGKRVASPGPLTTGNLLFRWTCPDCEVVYLPFTEIRGALLRDEVDAGVLIHEELLNYEEAGLRKIRCLGEAWFERTGIPLPVGLNVVRRDLGRPLATALVHKLRESILYGLAHHEEAFEAAMKYSIALRDGIADDFVGMFANQDTVELDEPTRQGLRILMDISCEINGLPKLPTIDVL